MKGTQVGRATKACRLACKSARCPQPHKQLLVASARGVLAWHTLPPWPPQLVFGTLICQEVCKANPTLTGWQRAMLQSRISSYPMTQKRRRPARPLTQTVSSRQLPLTSQKLPQHALMMTGTMVRVTAKQDRSVHSMHSVHASSQTGASGQTGRVVSDRSLQNDRKKDSGRGVRAPVGKSSQGRHPPDSLTAQTAKSLPPRSGHSGQLAGASMRSVSWTPQTRRLWKTCAQNQLPSWPHANGGASYVHPAHSLWWMLLALAQHSAAQRARRSRLLITSLQPRLRRRWQLCAERGADRGMCSVIVRRRMTSSPQLLKGNPALVGSQLKWATEGRLRTHRKVWLSAPEESAAQCCMADRRCTGVSARYAPTSPSLLSAAHVSIAMIVMVCNEDRCWHGQLRLAAACLQAKTHQLPHLPDLSARPPSATRRRSLLEIASSRPPVPRWRAVAAPTPTMMRTMQPCVTLMMGW